MEAGMAEVQRGNVFLTIQDDEIEKYMAKGFSVVDSNGRVIKQSVPTELGQLQKAYSDHVETIKQKDAEIARLKSELAALKTAGVKKTPAEKPESEDSWDNWAEEAEADKSVKGKKRKS